MHRNSSLRALAGPDGGWQCLPWPVLADGANSDSRVWRRGSIEGLCAPDTTPPASHCAKCLSTLGGPGKSGVCSPAGTGVKSPAIGCLSGEQRTLANATLWRDRPRSRKSVIMSEGPL